MTLIAYTQGTSISDLEVNHPDGGTWLDYVYATARMFKKKKKHGAVKLYIPLTYFYYQKKDLVIIGKNQFDIKFLPVGDMTFQHRWLMHTITELPYGDFLEGVSWTDKTRTIFDIDRSTPNVHQYSSPVSDLVEESQYFFTIANKGIHSGTCAPLMGDSGWDKPDVGGVGIPGQSVRRFHSSFKLADTSFVFDTLNFLKTLPDIPARIHTNYPGMLYPGHEAFAWYLIKYWGDLKGVSASISGQSGSHFTVPYIYPAGTGERLSNVGKWVLSHLPIYQDQRWHLHQHTESTGFWSQTGSPSFFDSETEELLPDSDFNHISFDMEEYLKITLEGTDGVPYDKLLFTDTVDISDLNNVTFTFLGEQVTGVYTEVTAGVVDGIQIIGTLPKTNTPGWGSEIPNDDDDRNDRLQNFGRTIVARSNTDNLYDSQSFQWILTDVIDEGNGLHTLSGVMRIYHRKREVEPPIFAHYVVMNNENFKYEFLPAGTVLERTSSRVIHESDFPVQLYQNTANQYAEVFPGGFGGNIIGTNIPKFDNTDGILFPQIYEWFLYDGTFTQIGYCKIVLQDIAAWNLINSYVDTIIVVTEICHRLNGTEDPIFIGDINNLQGAKDLRDQLDTYFAIPGNMPANDWMSYSMIKMAVNRINFVTSPAPYRYFFDFNT